MSYTIAYVQFVVLFISIWGILMLWCYMYYELQAIRRNIKYDLEGMRINSKSELRQLRIDIKYGIKDEK